MGRRQDPRPHPHAPLRNGRVRRDSGVRNRPRPRGVPSHRAHGAVRELGQDPHDGPALLGRRDGAGGQGHGALDWSPVVLHPAHRLLRLRRDGPQHAAVLGRRGHRVLAVGCVPGRRRGPQGCAHEDQLVDPPRPQHHAPCGQDHGQLRQQLVGQGRGPQGRLRRSHHAQPAGARRRVHRREHLRQPQWPVHHSAAVVRSARRHHAELGVDHRSRPRVRGRGGRHRPQRPLHRG
jgi:hypothetical protein